VCGCEWLGLSEELFFLLDGPGYGLLQWDEFFLLGAALRMGSGGPEEMSPGLLVATAAQGLQDCGAQVLLSSAEEEGSLGLGQRVVGVTCAMLRGLLMRRGQGCGALRGLLGHLRRSVDRLNSIARACGLGELLRAFGSVEDTARRGAPRLWQHAVLQVRLGQSRSPSLRSFAGGGDHRAFSRPHGPAVRVPFIGSPHTSPGPVESVSRGPRAF